MKRESEKEWYFGNADKERRGPFSFEEVCGLVKMFNFYCKVKSKWVKYNNVASYEQLVQM